MRILFLLFLFFPTITLAKATTLPELFSIIGIEENSKLDIHSEPKQGAAVIGGLAPGAKGIEVISFDANGEWALVNGVENSGWVETRFLRAESSVWENGKLPQTLRCHGTEPFWSVSFSNSEARLSVPDASEQIFMLQSVNDRGFDEDRLRVVQAGNMTGVIIPQQCSDGMSDKTYALQAVISLRNNNRKMLSGCCSIASN